MIWLFCSLFSAFGSVSWAKVVTLQEAVQLGLEASPVLNIASREHAVAQAELKTNLARFLPSLDLTSTHGLMQNRPQPLTTDPWTSEFKLSLTENLYDNGVTLNRYKYGSLRKDKTALELQKARDQLILDISVLYYKFQLASHIKAVRQKQNDRIMGEYRLAERQYRQGMKSRRDFLRFFSQVQRSAVDLEDSDKILESYGQDLKALLNAPEDVSFAFDKDLDFKTPGVPDKPLSYENTLTAKISAFNIKTGELDVSLVERKWWPEINLKSEVFYRNGNYLNNSSSFESNQTHGWNALVTLNFNLWDWGIRSRDTEIARQRQMILENSIGSEKLRLNAELKNLMIEIKQLAKTNGLNQEIFKAEEQTNKILTTEYQQGRLPYIDLITSINDFRGAEIALVNSYFRLKELLARYQFHEGTIYEKTLGRR